MDPSIPESPAGLDAADLEIFGFNGAPLVECGQALPIVRRKSTDRFFKLSIQSGPPPECSRAEIDAFAKEGRLTLLASPLPVPNGCIGQSGQQPMVIFVSQGLLRAAGCIRLEHYQGDLLTWQVLGNPRSELWVACATEKVVQHFLDNWAMCLLSEADKHAPDDWKRVQRLADLGLCAAADRKIRWRLWLRYAAALAWSPEPERVRLTFDRFIRREFPDCSWDAFAGDFGSLSRTLCARGPQPASYAPALVVTMALAPGNQNQAEVPEEPDKQNELDQLAEDVPVLPFTRSSRVAANGA